MVRQKFQRLSSGHTDEVWSRMRAGLAAKRTARSLGLATSTVRDYRCAAAGSAPVHDTGQQDG
jgi:FixJ family two-component response regulator